MTINSAGPRLVRAATHAAAWSPFLLSAVESLRGGWYAVGDGALIGLASWLTFSHRIPLIGQPTVLPGGPHDLGPAEFWLLAIPVRLDPARGQVWGAALLCLLAASITIEAARSVLGPPAGLLATGVILGLIAWMPALPDRPYWNPYFGTMWFLAALATSWAVMSGHRKWWPVTVACASLAAQAHLMFALASVGLAFTALGFAWADERKAKTGWQWLIIGLLVGETFWLAPLDQQFLFPPGNMTELVRGLTGSPPAGLTFAMKTLSAFTEPPPLWWQPHLSTRLDLGTVIQGRPAGFGIAIIVVTAVICALAVVKLKSRWLGSLAAVSLVADAATAITFAGLPANDFSRLNYLILVMFPVGLLAWLTIGSAAVLAGRLLLARWPLVTLWNWLAQYGTAVAAAMLIVLASLQDVAQAASYPGPGLNAGQVTIADRLINRALPARHVFALSVITHVTGERYRIRMGLLFALTIQGDHPDDRSVPRVVVEIRGSQVAVRVARPASAARTRPAKTQRVPR